MKPRYCNQRNRGINLFEVLVVVVIVLLLAAMLLPILAGAKRRPSRINCVSNLKQVDLSFRIWEGDNNNKYPMAVSVTNGGAMESVATGDVITCFLVMTNELSTPKILICPEDPARTCATNFGDDFNRSHISYFVGVDAEETHPDRIMSGDDNFTMGGVPVKSGLFEFSTNAAISWTSVRHGRVGNIGYADGSVAELSVAGLQQDLILTGLATNRFAIP